MSCTCLDICFNCKMKDLKKISSESVALNYFKTVCKPKFEIIKNKHKEIDKILDHDYVEYHLRLARIIPKGWPSVIESFVLHSPYNIYPPDIYKICTEVNINLGRLAVKKYDECINSVAENSLKITEMFLPIISGKRDEFDKFETIYTEILKKSSQPSLIVNNGKTNIIHLLLYNRKYFVVKG